MQDILRPAIEALAAQVELKTTEARPDAAHWQRVDKHALVERSLKRHEAGELRWHKRMESKKAQAAQIAAAAERYRRLPAGSRMTTQE